MRKPILRNPLSLFGLITIGLALFLAIFAYILAPDKSPSANAQALEISARKPGFSCRFLLLPVPATPGPGTIGSWFLGKPSEFRRIAIHDYEIKGDSLFAEQVFEAPDTAGLVLSYHLAATVHALHPAEGIEKLPGPAYRFLTASGQTLTRTADSLARMVKEKQIVNQRFLLGTDLYGRDLLSRLLIGLRISLAVGFIAVLISLSIGLILGSLAGYFGGLTDRVISWFIQVVWSIPTLLLVIAITFALGKGFWQVFIAVGLSMWVELARMVRGQVMSLKNKEFVEAARVLGFSHARILSRHIIPNILNPVIVVSAANFASAILMEAGLSFLGIGVRPPAPSLGTMIRDHYGYIIVDKAYLAIIPGLILMALVLAFTFLGNALRDQLDVRDQAIGS